MGQKIGERGTDCRSAPLAERARLDIGGIQAKRVRGSHSVRMKCNSESHSGGSHSVTGRDTAVGTAPGMRAAKSSEFGVGES